MGGPISTTIWAEVHEVGGGPRRDAFPGAQVSLAHTET